MICLVRESPWDYLQKHAQLKKLAEIFGEMGCWKCWTSSFIAPFTTRHAVMSAR